MRASIADLPGLITKEPDFTLLALKPPPADLVWLGILTSVTVLNLICNLHIACLTLKALKVFDTGPGVTTEVEPPCTVSSASQTLAALAVALTLNPIPVDPRT